MRTRLFFIISLSIVCLLNAGCVTATASLRKQSVPAPMPEEQLAPDTAPSLPQLEPAPLPATIEGSALPLQGNEKAPPTPPELRHMAAARLSVEDEALRVIRSGPA